MNNILNIYEKATEAQKLEGLRWYSNAFNICTRLAGEFQTDLKATCWAMSCLSPNNKWEQNIIDLVSALKSFEAGTYKPMMMEYEAGKKGAFASLYCRTYSLQIYKAFKCLEGDLTAIGKGRKTISFADNIFNPDSQLVTIDGHAFSIYLGQRLSMAQASPLIKKRYSEAEASYIETAHQVGLKPYELQAITWTVWRTI